MRRPPSDGWLFFEGQKNGLPSGEPRRLSKHERPWLSSLIPPPLSSSQTRRHSTRPSSFATRRTPLGHLADETRDSTMALPPAYRVGSSQRRSWYFVRSSA